MKPFLRISASVLALMLAQGCGNDVAERTALSKKNRTADADGSSGGEESTSKGNAKKADGFGGDLDAESAGTGGDGAVAGFALTDEEREEVAAQVDEVLQGIAEEIDQKDESTVSTNGGQLKAIWDGTAERSRNCSEGDDGSATIKVNRAASRSLEVTRDDQSIARDRSRSFSAERTWSRQPGSVRCSVSKAFLDPLSLVGAENISLATRFERKHDRELDLPNGDQYEFSFRSSGSRNLELAISKAEDKRLVRATFTTDVTRTTRVVGPEGEKAATSLVRTLEGSPIVIQAESSLKGPLHMRSSIEIESGAVGVKRANGTRIETEFHKVRFDLNQSICKRSSGEIVGTVTKADGSSGSFTVDFQEKRLVIKFDDGTEKEVQSALCAKLS